MSQQPRMTTTFDTKSPEFRARYRLELLNLKLMTVIANILLFAGLLVGIPSIAFLMVIQEYLWAAAAFGISLMAILQVLTCFSVRGILKLLITLDQGRIAQEQQLSSILQSPYASASSIQRSPYHSDAAPDSSQIDIRNSGSQIVENELIHVRCENCKSLLVCNEILIGHHVRCKKCNHRFEVTQEIVKKPSRSF